MFVKRMPLREIKTDPHFRVLCFYDYPKKWTYNIVIYITDKTRFEEIDSMVVGTEYDLNLLGSEQ